MTQKEKLYEQILITGNEYKVLIGKSEMTIDIDTIKKDGSFAAYAKMRSLAELKESLADMQIKVEKAKQAKAVEAYFATPEGAARKQELEEERKFNIRANRKLREEYTCKAKAIIEPILPENWKMDCTEVAYINIFLTDPVNGKKVFGHDFEIRLNTDWDKEDKIVYTLTTNIGSMGSFDPIHDFKRVSLYKVFADIVSNRKLMEYLESIMIQADASKQQSRENISNINKQLKNPLA